jgi:hypothetical protein
MSLEHERTRRRRREWSSGAMITALAAMVVVLAIVAFTLPRNSPLLATAPSHTSEPSTTGQGGLVPVRSRGDIER